MNKECFDLKIKCNDNKKIKLERYSNTLIKSGYNFDNKELFIVGKIIIEGVYLKYLCPTGRGIIKKEDLSFEELLFSRGFNPKCDHLSHTCQGYNQTIWYNCMKNGMHIQKYYEHYFISHYKNDKKHGKFEKWIVYVINDKEYDFMKTEECYYNEDELNGTYMTWDLHGDLIKSGYYKNNMRHGIWLWKNNNYKKCYFWYGSQVKYREFKKRKYD